jgi:hypothetical protein
MPKPKQYFIGGYPILIKILVLLDDSNQLPRHFRGLSQKNHYHADSKNWLED